MSFSLKDQIYNADYVHTLASKLEQFHPTIKAKDFSALALDTSWQARELKERMYHLSACLHQVLPQDYPSAIEILRQLVQTLPEYNFANLIFPDFVEKYGMEHWALSMDALELFTQYGSSEFGIRPFIIQDQAATMKKMEEWAQHENHHVRRLASEGCRPRLPWAMALPAFKKDPAPVLPILEQLKEDPEDYVYRSVANNLNDISKDHPDLVLAIGERWLGHHKHTDWAVKHALRTLLKKGNARAMRLFGFADPAAIQVDQLACMDQVRIGEELHFSFEVIHQEDQSVQLRLEYGIDYLKKRGEYNRKVFKITEGKYQAGATKVEKKQSFKNFSTRTHYQGTHYLCILINGVEKGKVAFEVV